MRSPEKKFSPVLRIIGIGLAGILTGLGIWLKPEKPQTAPKNYNPQQQALTSNSSPRSSPSQTFTPHPQSNLNEQRNSAKSSPKKSPGLIKEQEAKWQKFAAKFGTELTPEFNSRGQLVAIHGMPGQGIEADPNFKSRDPQKVSLRGQEIINAAHDLLGLNSDLPLSEPIPRAGLVTAQLYFRETYQGLPLLPEGNLKIDLGPKGEILGLYSDYLAGLKVVPSTRLSSQDAFSKALSSANLSNPGSSSTLDDRKSEGNKVIWVTQATQGHLAYQFLIRGREIIIDAGTGEVLSSRNRKQE
jgi:hypothetical protein